MLGKIKLPDDVVIEILSRLPAESLMRFKCVRKSCYILIQDSKFIALQLRNHVSNSRCNDSLQILLLSQWRRVSSTGDHAIAHDDLGRIIMSMLRYDGQDVSYVGKDADLIIDAGNSFSRISCHCDGIVCFDGYSEYAMIANPGIRQFRALPETCIPLPKGDHDHHEGYKKYRQTVTLGLGFDLRANDYKVVRVIEMSSIYGRSEDYYEVEVYNLSSNSWRQIEHMESWLYQFLHGLLSRYWNGAYYWPVAKTTSTPFPAPDSVENGILSFGFSDEVFQYISIPEFVPSIKDVRYPEYGIIEFNGVLALISYRDWSFEIWDMDSAGVHGNWTKLLSTESLKIDEHFPYQPSVEGKLPFRVATVLGVLKNDQLLLLLSPAESFTCQVASYSFINNQMKILVSDTEVAFRQGVVYKSSLVSIS